MARRACSECGRYLLQERTVSVAGDQVTVVECAVCDRRRCEHCDMPVPVDASSHCGLPFRIDVEAAIATGRLESFVDHGVRGIEAWLAREEAT